jgi:pyroglutamyl-peptidase
VAAKRKILLTSFRPWLEHHVSNASDDLLQHLATEDIDFAALIFLRQLPVDTAIAWAKVRAAIAHHQPDVVLCCGMAETRDRLTVESQALSMGQRYQTNLDLAALTQTLTFTDISDDAGKFVCEGLYFQVLKYLEDHQLSMAGLFLHIPLITAKNQALIFQDVRKILHYLTQSYPFSSRP